MRASISHSSQPMVDCSLDVETTKVIRMTMISSTLIKHSNFFRGPSSTYPPIKLSDSPSDVQRSPLLGEHTDEILGEIGMDSDAIVAAKAEGAI